jgi:hypothetical protein
MNLLPIPALTADASSFNRNPLCGKKSAGGDRSQIRGVCPHGRVFLLIGLMCVVLINDVV